LDHPRATIVISTYNRKDEVRAALKSTPVQTVPVEVFVIDDGTVHMARADFQTVHLHADPVHKGHIVRRNRGASLARTDVSFSIGDDAVLVSPRTVEQTLAGFDHPRVGAVAVSPLEEIGSALPLLRPVGRAS
jgi:glycosyltransferase involved in cell wall biosynthesis